MPPESYPSATSMYEQAQELKIELTERQKRANAASDEVLDAEIKDQEEKGIIPTEFADISDLKDQRISNIEPGFSADMLAHRLPISQQSAETTRNGRKTVESILRGEDDRLIVYIGPCSSHDLGGALEYNDSFSKMREDFKEDLFLVQRVYLEKPRSIAGWKGMINDPNLTEYLDPKNPQYDYGLGLIIGRMLMNKITHSGNGIITERLSMQTPQYTDALTVTDALGARNSLDQNGRALLSQTSAIALAKHPVDGSLSSGVDTVESIFMPHSSIGTHKSGPYAQIASTGNETAHMMLRGGTIDGTHVPNYSSEYVERALDLIDKRRADTGLDLLSAIGVDASHANSGKDFTKQIEVVENIAKQIRKGQFGIKEVMVESYTIGGSQTPPASMRRENVLDSQSITDGCSSVVESRIMLEMLSRSVQERRKQL